MTSKIPYPSLRNDATADNNKKTKEMFYRRKVYEIYAYNNIPDTSREVLIDLRYRENPLYGKVDTLYRPVIPKDGATRPFPDFPEHRALSFVVDSFTEFYRQINLAVSRRELQNVPVLQNLKIKRSYVSQKEFVNQNINLAMSAYIYFQTTSGGINHLMTFEQFMVSFEDFIVEYVFNVPVTATSLVMSQAYAINGTGLCVEFEDKGFSKDKQKIKFIDSPGFEYYLNSAARYGFYVDKNYPLRLVSNLSSPTTRKFASANQYGQGTPSSIFAIGYEYAHRNEIENLKRMALMIYRRFLTQRPSVKQHYFDDGKLISYFKDREFINTRDFQNKFPEEYWINLYIKIRNVESKMQFTEQETRKILERALNYRERVDNLEMMNYLNDVFMNIPITEGSTNDILNQRYLKDSPQERSFDDEDYYDYLRENYKKR